MRTRFRYHVAAAALIGVAAVVVACGDIVDRKLNKVYADADAPSPTPAECAMHRSLFVADLHADTMMWTRAFLQRTGHGHVDLPRLIEGNVGLQVFAVVTKTPSKRDAPVGASLHEEAKNKCIAEDSVNTAGLLQLAQLNAISTWFDLEERALLQAKRLKRFVRDSNERLKDDPEQPYLVLITEVDDLERVVTDRRAGKRAVGVLLALEGAHWIGGKDDDESDVRAAVGRLFDAGFRMVAPTHRFNNALAAASEGCDQLAGLTQRGRVFLDEAERLGMILDLAHASDRAIAEAAADRAGPIVISHTGVRRTCRGREGCDVERNMGDDEIRAVARTGGVVGIGYWPEAVGPGLGSVTAAFAGAHEALSEPAFVAEMTAGGRPYDPMDHIALGSDFDGAVSTPFDVTGLPVVTAALMRPSAGADGTSPPPFEEAAMRRIAGANICRVFALRLPGGSAEKAREICAPLLQPQPPLPLPPDSGICS